MDRDDALVDSVAAAIADGAAIDWRAIDREAEHSTDRELMDQLRVIDALASHAMPASPVGRFHRVVRRAWQVVLGIAIAKVALALSGIGLPIDWPDPSVSRWPFVVTLALFGVSGVVLLAGGGVRERSGRTLGALFLLIAAAFADPLMPAAATPVGPIAAILRVLPADAFLAVALWRFAAAFPTPPCLDLDRLIARVALVVSALVGSILFAANGLSAVWSADGGGVVRGMLALLDRGSPELAYWPVLFVTAASALPYLLWRARLQAPSERRRVAVLVLALVAGITPILVAVIVSPFVPALADRPWRQIVGAIVYAALLSIVPMTAYAAMVRRVIDVRLIIHRTTQHAAARGAVWALSLAPLVALAVEFYAHRGVTLAEFFGRPRSMQLVGLALFGVAVSTFRHQLLLTIDRWFLCDPIDVVEVIARLERGCRRARGAFELAEALRRELDGALRPRTIAVALIDRDASRLAPVAGVVPPLDLSGRLAMLLASTGTVLEVDEGATSLARWLPPEERQWLIDADCRLLAPLTASGDQVIGVVAIGPSRSELPWSRRDRQLVSAVCTHFALRLENFIVRHASGAVAGLESQAPSIDWGEEPAACCTSCGLIWQARTHACACGAATTAAVLPLIVSGKFRLKRQIGSSAASVVYRAADLSLGREVAVKTLQTLTPDDAERLQREARAMASVLHPNLALVFGVETWRGTPLLIVELLALGTLADRLTRGPLPIAEAIDLGVFMADALDRVHASGLLHRDIKPSNLGYTHDHTPKLLDFGLAAMLDHVQGSNPEAAVLPGGAPADITTVAGRIRGTPLYLSPEAAAGARPSASFDLWSLSMTLYEAVAGQHPLAGLSVAEVLDRLRRFRTPNLRTVRPECPDEVVAFFARALAAAPELRPATAGEIRNHLQRLRADLNPSRHQAPR